MSKIAVFIPSLQSGGGERIALFMAESLASAGFGVDLVVARSAGPLVDHPTARKYAVKLGALNEMLCLVRLIRYVRREKPDLLIAVVHTAKIMAGMAKVFLPNLPLVISVHNQLDIPRRKRFWFRAAFGYLPERWLYRNVLAAHVVCEALREQVARNFALPIEKVRRIYNPVLPRGEISAIDPAKSHWFEKPVVITIGRLAPQKNQTSLISAFAKSGLKGKARLLIIGEGFLETTLKKQCRDTGLENDVIFAGWVADPRPYMKKACGFVLSSESEGFALVLVEALDLGVPVVSWDTPVGPREVLGDGKFGRLVAQGDVEALALGMRDLVDGRLVGAPDDALAAHLGQFAPKCIKAQYVRLVEECLAAKTAVSALRTI